MYNLNIIFVILFIIKDLENSVLFFLTFSTLEISLPTQSKNLSSPQNFLKANKSTTLALIPQVCKITVSIF
ncbi:hypothetical protein HanIR_Chr11g0537391 [Helianthus annuus]|nr:hypothetical protein HanIR_Chr11g0537391 [Helianthus annuus]